MVEHPHYKKYTTTTNILQYFAIFCQYIRCFVLKSLQKAHSLNYLYGNYSLCTHLENMS